MACVRIEFLNSSKTMISFVNSTCVITANSSCAQYSVSSDPSPPGTKYVRFICNIEKPNGVSGISVANFDDAFFELSVDNHPPNAPGNPLPLDGASDVSITPTLSWSGGDPDSGDTVTYDVYFGTNSDPPKVSSGQSSTSYTPGTLAYTAKYYWKIVARDNNGTESTGPVWSFTTTYTNRGVDLAYQYLYEVMDKYHNSFDVYTDQDAGGNHFYASGWMGDLSAISFDSSWTSECNSGSSCIKITFTATENNWAGIYWQDPENNWCTGTATVGGYDITGATKITFWAKGENGGERVEFFAGGIKSDDCKECCDSLDKTSTGYITLTSSWQEYTIDLFSQDLSHVIGGFGWATNSSNNPNGATFYLDDIKYDKARPNELRFLVSYEILPLIDPDRYSKNVCFIYDNALALIAFLARGTDEDLRRAQILANAFVCVQKNDRYYEDGRLRNAYMSGDLKDHITGKARLPGWWDPNEGKWYEDQFQVSTHVGNLTWTMIALLNYYKSKGGTDYRDAAITLGEWIEKHTRDSRCDGGYAGGYDGWEPNPEKIIWKATEHNIDVYVAFMQMYEITGETKWKDRALYAKNFVDAMWHEKDQHFWTGTKDACEENKDNIPLDIQAWALMAFNKYTDALIWAEQNCYTEADGFKGFDFNNDNDGVWFEGTAQMAVAYQINNEGDKSNFYVEELQKAQASAQNTNGKGIVAASHDGVSTGFDWEYFSRLHVGATAWYIFTEMKYNPYWGIITIPTPTPQPSLTPIVTPTLAPIPTPAQSPTPTPSGCAAGSIVASPKKVVLKTNESKDVTAMVTGKEGCLVEGEIVKAKVNKAGKKLISVSPANQVTDENGEATFMITAKNKTGKAKVIFKTKDQKTKVKVKVVK